MRYDNSSLEPSAQVSLKGSQGRIQVLRLGVKGPGGGIGMEDLVSSPEDHAI